MLSKEEIEKAKEIMKPLSIGDFITWFTTDGVVQVEIATQTLLQYAEELEQENKALKKGQNSLMTSRKKWKDRYYKLKAKENKLNKMIDLMAKQIDKLQFTAGPDKDCFIPREYSDINDCVKKASCEECIKQYFEEKVEEYE